MKVKGILISILFVGMFSNETFAQDKAECEKIVISIVDAINDKSPENIENFLAPDFTFQGKKRH